MNQRDSKTYFKENEKSGFAIDKEPVEVVNEGLWSVGQPEVQKLRERLIRPYNLDNLQVPKVGPFIWRHISDKGKATDAAVQKAVSNVMPGLTVNVQQ